MMEGIPRFPAITEEEDAYMDIDGMWTVQRNFSSTYTITVDEMRDEFYGSLPEDTNDQHTFDGNFLDGCSTNKLQCCVSFCQHNIAQYVKTFFI